MAFFSVLTSARNTVIFSTFSSDEPIDSRFALCALRIVWVCSLLESTDLCGHPLMPPNWFLQLWIGQGGRGGISQGLRFLRQLREIPGRYCGGQWRRPVQKGPVLAEWYESRSRMIAKQDWA